MRPLRSSEVVSSLQLFFGYVLIDPLADFFVRESFSGFDIRQAFLDLREKPAIVIHEAFHCLYDQQAGVATLSFREVGELGFEVGMELDLHALRVG